MVSMVVKVLLAIRKTVLSAFRCDSLAASSWPSTLLTKCRRLPPRAGSELAKASSASTAICGPRSEPPMPMFTTSVMAESLRNCSAKASMAFSVECTLACSAALLWTAADAPELVAVCTVSTGDRGGFLNKVCHTSRCSVVLIFSPANMASRCSTTPHCATKVINRASVLASMRFLDKSAKT